MGVGYNTSSLTTKRNTFFERAHGTAHNISNINVIFTSPARGENLTDKDERFETYNDHVAKAVAVGINTCCCISVSRAFGEV